MRTILLFIGAALALSTAAPAQDQVMQRRPASPEGTVEVYNAGGSVQVVGWKAHEVVVSGALDERTRGLEVSGDSLRTVVRVVTPDGERTYAHGEGAHLKIQVPEESQVEVQTSGASIEVHGVNGALFLQSVSGDIRVTGAPRGVDAKSVRGEVEVSVSRSRVKIASVGGRVRLRASGGEAEVSTVSGRILVRGRLERGRFKSVSGDLLFEGDLHPKGMFEFSNHSGNVELLLPEAVRADFRVSTFSGRIETAFEGRVASVEDGEQGRRLSFATGSAEEPPALRGERAQPKWRPPLASELGLNPGRSGGPFPAGQPSVAPEPERARVSVDTFKGNVWVRKR